MTKITVTEINTVDSTRNSYRYYLQIESGVQFEIVTYKETFQSIIVDNQGSLYEGGLDLSATLSYLGQFFIGDKLTGYKVGDEIYIH